MYIDFIPFLQTERTIYLATERVEPLHNRLSRVVDIGDGNKRELYLSWGIFQITVCIIKKNLDSNFFQKVLID